MSNTKLSQLPSSMKIDVFIWPGRMNGADPMNVIRSSSGPTSSLRGNQFAALARPGVGLMPWNINPSCQRPIGTPPDNAAWMSAGLDGFLCEGMSSPSSCSLLASPVQPRPRALSLSITRQARTQAGGFSSPAFRIHLGEIRLYAGPPLFRYSVTAVAVLGMQPGRRPLHAPAGRAARSRGTPGYPGPGPADRG